MASIKERAAALNLAEKLCVRNQAPCVASKPVQSCTMWSSLISHLKSTVTVKRRRVLLKSHSDCFLGSEGVEVLAEYIVKAKGFEGAVVSRDKVVCVCQALLECGVFEAVGTKVLGKDKKQDAFHDSKSALYRFVDTSTPSVDELEKGVLVNGIQKFFTCAPSDRQEEQTCPPASLVEMSTPVLFTHTSSQLDAPATSSQSLELPMNSLSLSPCRVQTATGLTQSCCIQGDKRQQYTCTGCNSIRAWFLWLFPAVVDEVWQEQTLLRLLSLVEVPVLEGVLQCRQSPSSPSPANLAHNNPDLIYSSNHLDRQILKAFRDSQEDEWLCAALDCLDFLPDQPVVELSRELPHCFPQDNESCDPEPAGLSVQERGDNSAEHTHLSPSGLAQCKLLLYGTLVKHYSITNRLPLLPQHMTDVYTAITELLVHAKLDKALEALQLCLKLLPHSCRDELRRLLIFASLAADPHGIKVDKEIENRLAVKRSFSRAILHSKALSKEKEDLILVFMLSNVKEIFKIPGALHKVVSDKLACLVQEKQPDVTGSTFCQQVDRNTLQSSTKTTTNQALWVLLNNIHLDAKISAKEKKRLLRQFHLSHPEIFNQYFGDSAISVL
ncbi:DEP domain-containing protein 7-like isoform X2 [Simochromis diagramma]|uniref:DEP domain-containing protein 7-like isoform X2 n=1 Tax=Simochromis diagramma TaxID=43689 RepID=UPI001A7EC698|nr:DEP domain-containing protein 7-like isoform X2 [Simochromis diagramma]